MFYRMQTIGDRIRILREAKGWTQKHLSERITERGARVSDRAVSEWERGNVNDIKLRTFLVLVEVLGTTHEYLVNGPQDPANRDNTGRFRRPVSRTV